MTSLQTLTKVVVVEESSDLGLRFKLSELKGLNNLKGSLSIYFWSVRSLAVHEARAANLEGKKSLRNLQLSFVSNDDILEALQPSKYLEELTIFAFMGVKLPNWLSTLRSLISIDLQLCDKCHHLPPVHELPALRRLSIWDCSNLEYIADDEGLSSSSFVASFFPSLEELSLQNLPRLKGWWKTKEVEGNSNQECRSTLASQPKKEHLPREFPCLSKLTITNTPNMTSIPVSRVLKEVSLEHVSEILGVSPVISFPDSK